MVTYPVGLTAVEEYDPVSDTWTKKESMPTPLYSTASAVVDGKIYVIDSQSMGIYDPFTDTWDITKTPMPTERNQESACAVNGIIYVMGGVTPYDAIINRVQAYDPATDTWTEKSYMPTARHALGTAVVNGKIYAIGGGKTWNDYIFEEYNPITDRWTKKTDMPFGTGYFGCCVINDVIYVIGGGR
jgi:N-acetylneuraminic acid mutarotase